MRSALPLASQWLAALNHPSPALQEQLSQIYGSNPHVLNQRLELLRRAVRRYLQFQGDRPVAIHRAPGRINLRGMHVDTHGGYLNLMTHQREVVLVSSLRKDVYSSFVSLEETHPTQILPTPLLQALAKHATWETFIQSQDVLQEVEATAGHWKKYVLGVCVRAAAVAWPRPLYGIDGVITSDLPVGACLSSSAALCVAATQALLDHNVLSLTPAELVLAARDAEWFTGARTGTGDQTAVVVGRRGQVMNVAVLSEDFSLANAQHIPFPDALDLLVINSFTQRSLSGAERIAYTANRFAYSIALEVLRQEMRRAGYTEEQLARADRLSALTPDFFSGVSRLYELLLHVPQAMGRGELYSRYTMAGAPELEERYFQGIANEDRPNLIQLRGPLLYALAESQRARLFPALLSNGRFEEAGRLMCLGHDGDRVTWGERAKPAYEDHTLAGLAAAETPLELVPGEYGASSLVLDHIVDEAMRAGALGSCLTGAGIAGAVLALCRKENSAAIQKRLRAYLRDTLDLDEGQLKEAVVVNHAPMGAGELTYK